jgi:hypothetical protein
MVFFIPWRVVAKESGAAHFGFGGAMLFDLPQTARTTLRSPPFGITKFLPDASRSGRQHHPASRKCRRKST